MITRLLYKLKKKFKKKAKAKENDISSPWASALIEVVRHIFSVEPRE